MSRSLLAAAATAVTLVAAACGADNGPPPSEASGPVIQTEEGTATPYGTDAGQVWVLRPRNGRSTSVVVYLHGFGAYLPFEWAYSLAGSPARERQHGHFPAIPGRGRRLVPANAV